MKKILLGIMIFGALKSQAQNLYFNTSLQKTCATVDSIKLTYLKGSPSITTLCINTTHFNGQTVTFDWGLYYAVKVDSVTTNYIPVRQGTQAISVNGEATINDAMIYLANYPKDSLDLNINFTE